MGFGGSALAMIQTLKNNVKQLASRNKYFDKKTDSQSVYGKFIDHKKMSPKEFAKSILDASARTKRPVRILKQYAPSIDFPAALSFPESRYLKCWVIQA